MSSLVIEEGHATVQPLGLYSPKERARLPTAVRRSLVGKHTIWGVWKR